SEESGVTYTDISSPFEELSDIGSPRANDHEHLMLPKMLEDPYVEVALLAPPSPDYVPGLEHADDEIVAEDQPYAEDASPIAQSPEYVQSLILRRIQRTMMTGTLRRILLIILPMEEMTAMTRRTPVPMSAWTDLEIVRLLAMSSPPTSPLSPWSLPPPHIPFPPLPPILSPPLPVLSPAPSPVRSLGYRATMIQVRDEAASTSSPPLQLPSASRREDRPEVTLPPQKRLAYAGKYDSRVDSPTRRKVCEIELKLGMRFEDRKKE
nr:hypothetical protein [Tanacetum cinerariifolium]